MNSKQAGIYSITSKINGKRYIGSSIRICDRWKTHKTNLRINKHHSPHLQNHYNKYGLEDLIFSVVEIIERGDLTLQQFKELLLEKEQSYLNNWENCSFNASKNAYSCLGSKNKDSKYYHKNKKTYITSYTIFNKKKYFSSHILEEDAIAEVQYIKTLTEEQLIEYHKKCKTLTYKNPKNYSYVKKSNLYKTYYIVNGKRQHFNCHFLEEDAIAQVNYIKSLNEDELINYHKQCKGRSFNYRTDIKDRKKRSVKGFYYNKTANVWFVQFIINKKSKNFGSYKTEDEAIKKANEVKLELGLL
jgi:group I intron endonuclease